MSSEDLQILIGLGQGWRAGSWLGCCAIFWQLRAEQTTHSGLPGINLFLHCGHSRCSAHPLTLAIQAYPVPFQQSPENPKPPSSLRRGRAPDAQTGSRRRHEVKTILLLLVLMVTGAWGQKTQTCHSCSAADMNRQFPIDTPRHPKPERAKEQRRAKHAPSAKNHSDTAKPRPKEVTVGDNAHSQTQRP